MNSVSFLSQISLYILLSFIGLYSVLIWWWQIMVIRGRAMKNCDGSVDDWREQKTHYGMAVADVFLACPVSLAGIVLVFFYPRWGYYLVALVSFWFIWANMMTTATSLRFAKPKMSLIWWITFPFGGIVGLAYLIWTVIFFDSIYALS